MSFKLEIIKKFNGNILNNVNLSNYSWFNLGGPAEILFKPENKKQLMDFFKENQKNKFKITILGAGSNTLIRDRGIKGDMERAREIRSDLKTHMYRNTYIYIERDIDIDKDTNIGIDID